VTSRFLRWLPALYATRPPWINLSHPQKSIPRTKKERRVSAVQFSEVPQKKRVEKRTEVFLKTADTKLGNACPAAGQFSTWEQDCERAFVARISLRR
jgi:hypothetical protein